MYSNFIMFRNNRGQAMPQIMLAVGLVALLGLTVSQVGTTITKNRQNTEFTREADAFTAMMRGFLSSEKMCDVDYIEFATNPPGPAIDNYGGNTGTNGGIKTVNATTGRADLQIDLPFYGKTFHKTTGPPANRGYAVDDFRLNVEKFEFVQLRAHIAADDNVPQNERKYEGTIRVVLSAISNPNRVVTRDIGKYSIYVQLNDPDGLAPDTSGQFARCVSQTSSDKTCVEMGGVPAVGLAPSCSFPLKSVDCQNLGPDYYIRSIDASGNVTCQQGLLECAQPLGQIWTLIGINNVSGVPTAICRQFYLLTGGAVGGAYSWRQKPFGPCTVTCGGGTQTTAGTECYDTTTLEEVASGFCTGAGKPDPGPATQACNPQPCDCTQTYSWTVGPNQCSAPISNISNGAIAQITDSTLTNVGTAYFACVDGYLTVDGAPSSGPLFTTSTPAAPSDPTCAPPPPAYYAFGTGCATCPWGTQTFTWSGIDYGVCSLGPAAANGTFTYQYAGRNDYTGSWTWWSATSSAATQQNALCSVDADGAGPGLPVDTNWEIRRCSVDYQVYDSSSSASPRYLCPIVIF